MFTITTGKSDDCVTPASHFKAGKKYSVRERDIAQMAKKAGAKVTPDPFKEADDAAKQDDKDSDG